MLCCHFRAAHLRRVVLPHQGETPVQDVTEGVATTGSRNLSGEDRLPLGDGSGPRGRCQVQMGLRRVARACESLDTTKEGSPLGR